MEPVANLAEYRARRNALGEPLLTKAQLSQRLGVCERTVENWMRDRGLPTVRYGPRMVRFRLSEVEAWRSGMS